MQRSEQQGNRSYFQHLFHTYDNALCQYAYTLQRDLDEAYDIIKIAEKAGDSRKAYSVYVTCRHSGSATSFFPQNNGDLCAQTYII